jgi:hypothetical protein
MKRILTLFINSVFKLITQYQNTISHVRLFVRNNKTKSSPFPLLILSVSLLILPFLVINVNAVDRYFINGSPSNDPGSNCGEAQVMMDNMGDVQGFALAICHDPDVLMLDKIDLGQAVINVAPTPSFNASNISNNPPAGGTLAVVLSFTEQIVIPAGSNNNIAKYRYCCKEPPQEGEPPVETDLTFCDGTLSSSPGGQPVNNVFTVGGNAVTPTLEDGTFTCNPPGPAPTPTPTPTPTPPPPGCETLPVEGWGCFCIGNRLGIPRRVSCRPMKAPGQDFCFITAKCTLLESPLFIQSDPNATCETTEIEPGEFACKRTTN